MNSSIKPTVEEVTEMPKYDKDSVAEVCGHGWPPRDLIIAEFTLKRLRHAEGLETGENKCDKQAMTDTINGTGKLRNK